jgi:hypothetical protein
LMCILRILMRILRPPIFKQKYEKKLKIVFRPYSGRILTVFLCILITREEYVSCPYLMCICARIFTVFFHSQTSEKNTYLSRIPN